MDDKAQREALEAAKAQALADLSDARKRGDAEAVKAAKAANERASYAIRNLGHAPDNGGIMPRQTGAYVAFLARHFPRALGLMRPTRPGMAWKPDPTLLAAAEAEARKLRLAHLHSQVVNREAKASELAAAHLRPVVRLWATEASLRRGALKRIAAELAKAIQQGGRAIDAPRKPHPEDAPMIDAPRLGTPAARLGELRRLDAALRTARRTAPVPWIVKHFRALERSRAATREAGAARRRFELFFITLAALNATPSNG